MFQQKKAQILIRVLNRLNLKKFQKLRSDTIKSSGYNYCIQKIQKQSAQYLLENLFKDTSCEWTTQYQQGQLFLYITKYLLIVKDFFEQAEVVSLQFKLHIINQMIAQLQRIHQKKIYNRMISLKNTAILPNGKVRYLDYQQYLGSGCQITDSKFDQTITKSQILDNQSIYPILKSGTRIKYKAAVCDTYSVVICLIGCLLQQRSFKINGNFLYSQQDQRGKSQIEQLWKRVNKRLYPQYKNNEDLMDLFKQNFRKDKPLTLEKLKNHKFIKSNVKAMDIKIFKTILRQYSTQNPEIQAMVVDKFPHSHFIGNFSPSHFTPKLISIKKIQPIYRYHTSNKEEYEIAMMLQEITQKKQEIQHYDIALQQHQVFGKIFYQLKKIETELNQNIQLLENKIKISILEEFKTIEFFNPSQDQLGIKLTTIEDNLQNETKQFRQYLVKGSISGLYFPSIQWKEEQGTSDTINSIKKWCQSLPFSTFIKL